MAFSDRVAQRELAVMFYVRISGLPYIFSSLPIPSAWDAGSGTVSLSSETYTWNTSIVTDDGFASVSQRAEPKAGVGTSGSLTIDFRIGGTQAATTSDVWLDIINNSLGRADANFCTLLADLTSASTGPATADTITGFASSGYLYAGTETIQYGGTSGSTFTSLTRARYGSWAQYHLGDPDNIRESGNGGVIISDTPLVLEGRLLEVWMATGTLSGRTFTPYGSTIRSAEDWNVYTGVVSGSTISRDIMTVSIETTSLDSLLSRQVATRLPQACAGHGRGWQYIQIDSSNNVITWVWSKVTGTPAASSSEFVESPIYRDDGTGTAEAVPDGLYHYVDVSHFLDFTLHETGGQPSVSGDYQVLLSPSFDDDKPRFAFRIFTTDSSASARNWSFTMDVAPGPSLWKEIGFTQSELIRGVAPDVGTGTLWEHTADRHAAVFYWPLEDVGSRRLYYRRKNGPDFDAETNWTDDTGTAISGYLIIGDQDLVKIDSLATDSRNGLPYAVITEREQLGVHPDKDIWEEWEEDSAACVDLIQPLAFPGCSAVRMMLYLILGVDGSGTNDSAYDKGWRGAGAAIPVGAVNKSAFLAIDAERTTQRARDNWAIREATPLRDVMSSELILEQLFAVPIATASGFQINLLTVDPAQEDEAATAHTINHSVVDSLGGDGIGFDRGVDKLINVVSGQGAYDIARKKYFIQSTSRHAMSIGTWGEQPELKVNVRGIRGAEEYSNAIEQLCQGIWTAYAAPYVIVEFDIARMVAWSWQIGDAVSITHTGLPAVNSVGRGVSGLLGRIYAKTDYFKRNGVRSRVTIVIRRYGGQRFATWSPACLLSAKASDTSWTAAENTYSDSTEADDITHFAIGDYVYAFNPGSDGSGENAMISNISGSTVTFASTGVTLAAPVIIEARDYDTVGMPDDQRKHVFYGSPQTNRLALPTSGTDPGFTYQ